MGRFREDDQLCRTVRQDPIWHVLLDVLPVWVVLPAKHNRGVHSEVLREERRGTQPHPVAGIQKVVLRH